MIGLLARLALPPGLGKLLGYIGGAALVIALLWALWARGDHYKAKLAVANAQIEAGKQNVVALKADKARLEKQQAATTERIDHETAPARRDALAASNDYARAHRCVQSSSPVVATSQPSRSVPDVPAAAGSAETSGEAAAMVAVPKWGIDACSLNSADLDKAVDWAQSVSGR